MNEQQKEILKSLWTTFDDAYTAFIQYAYSISDKVGSACDRIDVDTMLDIKDELRDLEVLEPFNDDDE